MKKEQENKKGSLNFMSIFRYLMEEGYFPTYETTHILFELEDNTALLEYEDGMLSIMVFFSIDEETSALFILGSNSVMTDTKGIKALVLEDEATIMFSAEFMCDNLRELRKFFPKALHNINHALAEHKKTMKVILEESVLYKDLYTHSDKDNASKKFCS
jgi:ketol-acid reductoisomerase